MGFILRSELAVALLNGTVWGMMFGLSTLLVYGNMALAGVAAVAMMLSINMAVLPRVGTPYLLALLDLL